MRTIVFLFLFGMTSIVLSQPPATLQDCYSRAMKANPTGLQTPQLEKINHINQKIISTSWLPQLQFSAQATYQSHVTEIDLDFPGIDFPGPTRDQYRMSVEAQQLIYDGGMNKRQQALREASHKAEVQEVDVQVFQLLEQVNRHFFQHFLLEEHLKNLQISMEEINQKLSVVISAINHGTQLPSSQWILEAELLKLQQTIDEIRSAQISNLEILAILTGDSIHQLELPDDYGISDNGLNRPEPKLFTLQKDKLFATSQLSATSHRPVISSFMQAGYGKPGLNMLSNDFELYYLAGIRLQWKMWDWNKNHRERQILRVQAERIDVQQQVFEQNISVATTALHQRISQMEKALEQDLQIIDLQTKILEGTEAQLQRGVINSTEYIHRLNALYKARIDFQTRKIRRIQAIEEFNLIMGNI